MRVLPPAGVKAAEVVRLVAVGDLRFPPLPIQMVDAASAPSAPPGVAAAEGRARLVRVLLPPPLLRCSRSSAAYPPRTALSPCRM
jgi:hypothetical protein